MKLTDRGNRRLHVLYHHALSVSQLSRKSVFNKEKLDMTHTRAHTLYSKMAPDTHELGLSPCPATVKTLVLFFFFFGPLALYVLSLVVK